MREKAQTANAELRRIIRQLQIDKRNLATENLSLLHRARLADRIEIGLRHQIAAISQALKSRAKAGCRGGSGATLKKGPRVRRPPPRIGLFFIGARRCSALLDPSLAALTIGRD